MEGTSLSFFFFGLFSFWGGTREKEAPTPPPFFSTPKIEREFHIPLKERGGTEPLFPFPAVVFCPPFMGGEKLLMICR